MNVLFNGCRQIPPTPWFYQRCIGHDVTEEHGAGGKERGSGRALLSLFAVVVVVAVVFVVVVVVAGLAGSRRRRCQDCGRTAKHSTHSQHRGSRDRRAQFIVVVVAVAVVVVVVVVVDVVIVVVVSASCGHAVDGEAGQGGKGVYPSRARFFHFFVRDAIRIAHFLSGFPKPKFSDSDRGGSAGCGCIEFEYLTTLLRYRPSKVL